MNSSVQDAVRSLPYAISYNFQLYLQFNLAWKLSLVVKGLAPSSLIDTYSRERLPVIAAMLNKTTELFERVFPLDDRIPEMKETSWDRSADLHQLGDNYRGSPIVLDERTKDDGAAYNAYGTEGDTLLRAGDRAPDSPGLVVSGTSETKALYEIFHANHHTVLVFGSDTENTSKGIEGLLKRFPQELFRLVNIAPQGTSPVRGTAGQNELSVEDRDREWLAAHGQPH